MSALTIDFDPVDMATDKFGLSKREFAETIGVNVQNLYRKPESRPNIVSSRASEALEIIARVTQWAGGPRQAVAWYRSEPLPAFGDRTAEALVKEGKAAAVRDYMDHIATGGFA